MSFIIFSVIRNTVRTVKAAHTSGLRGLFLPSGHGVSQRMFLMCLKPQPCLERRARKKTEQIFLAGENLRPRNPLVWAFLIILLYLSTVAWIWQSDVIRKNRQGNKLYNENRIDDALSKWRDAQIESPDKEELHYNIGSGLYQQKKYEDAFNEYEKSLSSKDGALLAKAYYNMGNSHYRMGKLPEAIEDYKKCLDINPNDGDAKYNIEFIRKKIKEDLEKESERQKEMQKDKTQEQKAQAQKQELEGTQGEKEKKSSEMKEEESKEEKKEAAEKEEKDIEEGPKERRGVQKEDKEKEGEMSKQDAIRLLDALKDDEKDLQRELRRRPIIDRHRVDKDW